MMVDMSDANGGNGANGPGGSGESGGSGGTGWGSGGMRDGKRLERKLEGRWLAGVCVGLAAYLGVDPNLVRVIVAVLTLFGGLGALIYVLAWALIPEEGERESIAERLVSKSGG